MAKANGKASGNKVEPDASNIPAVDPANPNGAASTEKQGDLPVDGATDQPIALHPATDAALITPAAATDAPSPDVAGPEGAADTLENAIDTVPALWVRSVKPEGFRRCGFRFPHEGIGIAVSALTDEQIETLSTEPNLVAEPTWFPASDVI